MYGYIEIEINIWRHTIVNGKSFFGFEITFDGEIQRFDGLNNGIATMDEYQLKYKIKQLIENRINQSIKLIKASN
ncbi:MAG: hypothetical protein ACLFQP_00645 [Halothece sp.]